jgi:hypothetical protein
LFKVLISANSCLIPAKIGCHLLKAAVDMDLIAAKVQNFVPILGSIQLNGKSLKMTPSRRNFILKLTTSLLIVVNILFS